jgi:hypothetical protein
MLVPFFEIDGIAVCFGTKKAPQKYRAFLNITDGNFPYLAITLPPCFVGVVLTASGFIT